MELTAAQLILQDRKIGYVITDRSLKVLEVSGASALYDSHKNLLGRSLFDLVPELVGSEDVLADILAGNVPRHELACVNREAASGQTVCFTMVDLPYRDRMGRITGILHLVEDITEAALRQERLVRQRNQLRLVRDQLAQHNRQLGAANTELRRLDGMKSMFVSVAAHELRTPLTSISGFLEMLLDEERGPLTDDQREYLEIAQRCADRLLNITNNLLDVTRIEAGRVELKLQPTDLTALMESVATEFGPQLEAKQQRLTLRASTDLPLALCDRTRAEQIIRNLLSNASKYSPRGTLINVSVSPPADTEGFLIISVEDQGVGIAAADQAQLFNCFYRAESGQFTDDNGVGLGLYITRSLIELHGGKIWVDSQPGRGSTFYVTFPVAGKQRCSATIITQSIHDPK